MIQPTVGRVVWFREAADSNAQPMAAIIAHVLSDRCVNLLVIDRSGTTNGRTSIELLQDGEQPGGRSSWCEWMPYQKGQAAKTEALEQQLGGAGQQQAL